MDNIYAAYFSYFRLFLLLNYVASVVCLERERERAYETNRQCIHNKFN